MTMTLSRSAAAQRGCRVAASARSALTVIVAVVCGGLLGAGLDTPLAAEAQDANGKHLYMRNCAACHGEGGRGNGPEASQLIAPPRNLREDFLRKYSTADLVRRIRDSRSLEIAIDLPALKARANDTEAIVAHLKRLPATNWQRVAPAWVIYLNDGCETCHGLYGRPPQDLPMGVQRPRDLSDPDFQRAATDEKVIAAVRHGKGHMPLLIPRVSQADAAAVVAYIRILSPGYTLYSEHCATCHGDDGRGVDADTLSAQSPTFAFDRAYFAKREPEQIRDGVWHMLDAHKSTMPHFRRALSESQAQAIVEYLKQTEPKKK